MKKKIILALVCICCLSAAVANVNVGAAVFVYNLFDLNNCYSQTNAAVPTDTGITVAYRGLQITAKGDGASVSYKNTASGLFDISFLPYSSATYGGSSYEGDSYDNKYQDLDEMSLVFTETNGSKRSFAVRLTGGADGNNVTVNASVETNDYRGGMYYYRDNNACGSTSGYNANGVYTYLYGCSFSNVAVASGAYASANVRPVRIVFDPVGMKVYGYNYGYNAYAAEKRLIWDMGASVNDGRNVGVSYSSFEQYTVSLVFDKVKAGKTASIVLYSINGQNFANSVATNTAGPECAVFDVGAATVGESYTLKKPTCFDVVSGIIDFDGLVKVVSPDGETEAIYADGAKVTPDKEGFVAWQDGVSFVCRATGDYTITYKAKDGDGIYGQPYTVTVAATAAVAAKFIVTDEYETYLRVGANITVPGAKWIVGDGSVGATCVVSSPDGTILQSPYTAAQQGRYTLTYSAEWQGKQLTTNVYVYAFEDNDALLRCTNGVSVTSAGSDLHSELAGLVASTTVANGTITYKQTIDIKNKTKDDTLISFMALPRTMGTSAMGQIAVRLTDSANDKNYVLLLVSPSTEQDMSVVRAGSAEQTPAGRSNSGSVESYVGGGTKFFHSFYGVANYVDITKQFVDVRMDYKSRQIYVGDKLVCDLDDSEYFVNAWDGFEGDAILSVTMRELSGDSASILIDKIDGQKIYGKYHGDCVSPVVGADFDETDIPKAVVGRKYPLLPVRVTDNVDALPDVQATVTDRNGVVEVTDNAFVPTAEGEYYITFVATDKAGNQTTVRYTVNAYTGIDPLDISTDGDVPSQAYVGEKIILPACTVGGGSGMNVLTVTATGKNTGTVYNATDLVFVPLVQDTYEVVYAVTDYLGTKQTTSQTVGVTINDKPVFDSTPQLPEILISGRATTLPQVNAYDYKANKPATVAVTVEVDGTTEKVGNDLVYVPRTAAANVSAEVVYTATAASGATQQMRFDVSIVSLRDEDGALVLSRYFVADNTVNLVQNEDYLTLDFGACDDKKIEFVKQLYSHGFELTFDVPSGANNFNKLSITLTDAADPDKKVVFTARKGGFADRTTVVSINGLQEVFIEGNFFESVKLMRVAYDNKDYSVKDSSGLTVGYVKYYADGSLFRGFSDTVFMQITAEEVQGTSQINLYKVGNQLLMENDNDYTQPIIVTDGEISRSVRKGQNLVVSAAKAYDVLGFETTTTVSVVKGGKVILANTSADKEYTVTLDEYGEYTIVYSAVDDNDNVANATLVVNVRDDVAPTIQVDRTELIVYANTAVKLPKATATDDVSVAKEYVFVIDCDNNMINVTGKEEYTPAKKGIYTIRYVAVDSSGNYGIVDVVLKVAEAKQ